MHPAPTTTPYETRVERQLNECLQEVCGLGLSLAKEAEDTSHRRDLLNLAVDIAGVAADVARMDVLVLRPGPTAEAGALIVLYRLVNLRP